MSPIEKFWRYFHDSHHLLARDPDKDAMEKLLSLIRNIDRRLYFHLGERANATDLILSAEGNPDLMDILFRVKAQQPRVEGWKTIVSYSSELLFGDRDFSVFPDNATGAALFTMATGGDKLWIERPVDFSAIFPTQADAESFCAGFEFGELNTDITEYNEVDGFLASVNICKVMCPTATNIGSFEDVIHKAASMYGGRNDGWGCFGAPDES